MLFKLAFRNLRRSLRDYAIYFVTLTMAVLLFQMFRTATSQDAFEALMGDGYFQILNISEIMQVISWFMLAVLAFLIVYANSFMLKRRNREIGTYLILGMKPGRLASLLAIEIALLNILATLSGLILGTFAAQWLSLLILQIHEMPLNNYAFVYSQEASLATLISFIAITLLVLGLITFQLTKVQLADLLRPARKSSHKLFKKPWQPLLIFALAVACLTIAYSLTATIPGTPYFESYIIRALVFGIAGTVLLMFSLSGFLVTFGSSFKRFYYKHLNFFTLRNMSSRIHTGYLSLAVTSLLLFFTLTVLLALFSATSNSEPTLSVFDTEDLFDLQIIKSRTFKDYTETAERAAVRDRTFNDYQSRLNAELDPLINAQELHLEAYDLRLYHPIPSDDIVGAGCMAGTGDTYSIINLSHRQDMKVLTGSYGYYFLSLMSHDEAARIMAQHGEAWDYSSDSSVLLGHPTAEHAGDLVRYLLSENLGLILRSPDETSQYNLQFSAYSTDNTYWPILGSGTRLMAVVPDEVITAVSPVRFALDTAVTTSEGATQEELEAIHELIIQTQAPFGSSFAEFGSISINSREIIASEMQERTLSSLIGIYFSINFLLITATILALKYLSELSDNQKRYRLLGYLGARSGTLKKQIMKETLYYFVLPLGVALISFIFSIRLLADPQFFFQHYIVLPNVLPTLALVISFLALYFVLTSWTAVRLVLEREA